jgi:hypothetical protein
MLNEKLRQFPSYKMGDRLLAKEQIGELIENWISGISIINCSKRYGVSYSSALRYIGDFYLFKSGEGTEVLTRQSKVNSLP